MENLCSAMHAQDQKQTYHFVLLLFVKKGDVLVETAFSFNFQTKELLMKKYVFEWVIGN